MSKLFGQFSQRSHILGGANKPGNSVATHAKANCVILKMPVYFILQTHPTSLIESQGVWLSRVIGAGYYIYIFFFY